MFSSLSESRAVTSPPVENNAGESSFDFYIYLFVFVHPVASNNPPCLLVSNKDNSNEPHTIFLRDGWRNRLCRCVQCCVSFDLQLIFSFISLYLEII